ncbi:MAG: D-Ala-D-Ala carboxypeptidase family metallohydrolase [Acetobacterium sp.]|uniref:D-Ala-D-Ala carboxypeptidase family metallohydrolase n=1 Tax=Acetobacterium sp. TaxID=1872094 RepID=UPI0032423DF5
MNEFIAKVQTALAARGYHPGPLDGREGPKTQKAVKAFQRDSGLSPDGVVGTLTANRLFTEQLSVISFDSDGSTAHFARAEFGCDCGGAYCDGFPAEMNLELLLKLEALRNALNVPVIITSGVRCQKRNAEVGGVDNSQHLVGQAADLYAPGIAIATVAAIAESLGLMAIIYEAEGFVHLAI